MKEIEGFKVSKDALSFYSSQSPTLSASIFHVDVSLFSLVPDKAWRTVELVGMEMFGKPLAIFLRKGSVECLIILSPLTSSHSTVIYISWFELFLLFLISSGISGQWYFRHFFHMRFLKDLGPSAPEKRLRMPSNVRLIAQGKYPPEAETPGILPRISLHSSWFLAAMTGKCCMAAGWNMLKIPSCFLPAKNVDTVVFVSLIGGTVYNLIQFVKQKVW